MTFFQCGHFDFSKMTDEEIKAQAKVVRGETEYHGPVSLACCEKCYKPILYGIARQYSIEGNVINEKEKI